MLNVNYLHNHFQQYLMHVIHLLIYQLKLNSLIPILENKITSPGNKFIFIRVISPSGNVLTQNKKETISIDQEKTIEISAKREINYQNQNTDVCIYYEIEATLNPGKYSVEIYAENQKIGLTSFALK